MRWIKFILFFLIVEPVSSQNWNAMGNFSYGVTTLYIDSISNEMYIGGSFCFINSDTIVGIAKWNGISMATLGCGVEWDCISTWTSGYTPSVNGIIRYNNQIYVTGGFTKAGNETVNGIARWNGINWENFGTGLKIHDGTQGIGIRLQIINNELYICGVFDSIAGIPANSIAKYDGSNWSAVHNFPLIPTDLGAVNRINDIAYYKNELYVCGNLNNLPIGTIFNIVKWDGANWVSVDSGIRGSIIFVNKMAVYKDELIVGGLFSKTDYPNNPGTNIAKWDGSQWTELGGGVDGMIHDIKVHNDTLYACGAFMHAGGIAADGIARWDGNKWCGYGTSFDNVVGTLEFYHDTLYIGGGFWTINGDSISSVAKWLGGSYVAACGNTSSINEINNKENNIALYPNPASNQITLQLKSGEIKSFEVSIYNKMGQAIFKQDFYNTHNTFEKTFSIQNYPSGIYFILIKTDKSVLNSKFIKL